MILVNKIGSSVMLAGGVVLIIFGCNATSSFGSDVSKLFAGSATDRAVWMLIGGTVATLVGLVWTVRSWKQA